MYLRDNKFIISCAARTGSTMLVHLLRDNPKILCHGEVFGFFRGLGHIMGTYARKRKRDCAFNQALIQFSKEFPERFLYDIVFDSQDREIVGFKFKTDEHFHPDFRSISRILERDQDIKVVMLKRRDLLSQFISHKVANKTGVTMLFDDEPNPQIRRFKVALDDCRKYFIDVCEREKKSVRVFSSHRRASVYYEDLIDEGHEIRARIQVFLGVAPVSITTNTKKVIEDNYALVNNLDDVLDMLIRSGFSHRLSGVNEQTA